MFSFILTRDHTDQNHSPCASTSGLRLTMNRKPQVGDVLDRGDQELQIFHMLERLQHQARKAGGDVHVLNGNHETINVEGRFTYATAGSKSQFDR